MSRRILNRKNGRPILVCLLALAAARCGSSSVSLDAPSGSKCEVALANSMPSAPASGANGNINITTNRDCAWTASAGAPWISLTSAASGQGAGSVGYRVAANSEPVARRATLAVNGAEVSVSQEAACRFTIAPSTATIESPGGALTVTITSADGCAWATASRADWLQVTSGAAGSGTGTVTIAVAANHGAARSGTLLIAGQTFTVDQAAEPAPDCGASLSASAQTVAAEGGAGAVAVTIAPGCRWTASSAVDWAAIADASGTGPGVVHFTVAPNPSSSSRQGILTIAGHTVTVTQNGQTPVPCTYSVQPLTANLPAAGGGGMLTLATTSTCAWSATSNAAWMTIAPGSGTGNATLAVNVSANSGAARTGTATIAGATFTVTQAAEPPCSYSIAPTSLTITAAGAIGSVAVTADGSCAWTATSNAGWIIIASGSSGSGNGTVGYIAAANIGAARTGTMTIAGQTFTLTQAAVLP